MQPPKKPSKKPPTTVSRKAVSASKDSALCRTLSTTDEASPHSSHGRADTVNFFLQRSEGGLYVEREHIPGQGLQTQQSLEFASRAEFDRWCDGDPIRFEHPLLHARLQRAADDLWELDVGISSSSKG